MRDYWRQGEAGGQPLQGRCEDGPERDNKVGEEGRAGNGERQRHCIDSSGEGGREGGRYRRGRNKGSRKKDEWS